MKPRLLNFRSQIFKMNPKSQFQIQDFQHQFQVSIHNDFYNTKYLKITWCLKIPYFRKQSQIVIPDFFNFIPIIIIPLRILRFWDCTATPPEAILNPLLFPDRSVTTKQMMAFTLSRALNSIPESDRPQKIQYKIAKCSLSPRQQLIYSDLLNQSSNDLDSQAEVAFCWEIDLFHI